jgi:DNA-binding cell septation regulator SpoVG
MQISRMTKGEWNKVRAFFDLQSEEGFTIKGFKLVEGNEGMFVGFPSQKNKDGEYQDTIFADKILKQKVNKLALDYYNDGGSDSSEDLPF